MKIQNLPEQANFLFFTFDFMHEISHWGPVCFIKANEISLVTLWQKKKAVSLVTEYLPDRVLNLIIALKTDFSETSK